MGLLAFYVGFLSCFVRGIAMFTLYFAVVALARRKPHASYGSIIVGNVGAIFGIILSLVALVIHGCFLYSISIIVGNVSAIFGIILSLVALVTWLFSLLDLDVIWDYATLK